MCRALHIGLTEFKIADFFDKCKAKLPQAENLQKKLVMALGYFTFQIYFTHNFYLGMGRGRLFSCWPLF
jgi:hypothetical protein